MHRHIIRCVELFVVKTIYQYGDGTVVFSSRYPPRVMLAGDQPTLAIPTVAVAVVRRAAENADLSGFLEPSQDAVVRDVAEEEIGCGKR